MTFLDSNKSFTKKIKREQDQISVRLKKKLNSVETKSLNLTTPKRARFSGVDTFRNINARVRCTDRRNAFFDCCVARLHKRADPFASYRVALDAEAYLLLKKAYTESRAIDTTGERLLARAEVAKASQDLDSLVAYKETFNFATLDLLDSQIDIQITQIKELYDRWLYVLQRPSYREIIDDVNSWLRSKASAEGEQTDRPRSPEYWWYPAWRFMQRHTLKVLVPIETFYVYPAFLFLFDPKSPSPLQQGSALAAAFVFVAILVLSGAGFASLTSRAFEFRTDDLLPKTTCKHRFGLLCAAYGFLAIGLGSAFFGAELRGTIPEIINNQITADRLNKEKIRALTEETNNNSDDNNGIIKERINKIEEKIAINDNERRGMLNFKYSENRIDVLVSIFMYLGLLAAAASQRAINRDPYVEYDRLANELAQLRDDKMFVSLIRDAAKRDLDGAVLSCRSRLGSARALLGIYDPEDSEATPKIRRKSDDDVESKAFERQEDNESVIEALESDTMGIVEAWKRSRLKRYMRWYLFFLNKEEKEYDKIFVAYADLAALCNTSP